MLKRASIQDIILLGSSEIQSGLVRILLTNLPEHCICYSILWVFQHTEVRKARPEESLTH